MFTKELMEDIDAFIADTLTKLTPEMYSERWVDFTNNTHEFYYINISNLDNDEYNKQYTLVVSDENGLISGTNNIQSDIYANIPYSNLKHFLKSQLFLLVEQVQNIK